MLSAFANSTISLPGISCLSFGSMTLNAAMSQQASQAWSVNSLALSGAVSGCGLNNAQSSFAYDKSTQNFAFGMGIDAQLPSPFVGSLTGSVSLNVSLPSTSGNQTHPDRIHPPSSLQPEEDIKH